MKYAIACLIASSTAIKICPAGTLPHEDEGHTMNIGENGESCWANMNTQAAEAKCKEGTVNAKDNTHTFDLGNGCWASD